MEFINKLKFNKDGLIPAIVQDYKTNEVLMLAYMNKESIELTIETEKVHYYSRSRQKLWLKGETSGNFQYLKDMFYDCDGDTLLLKIKQMGPACHTGNQSCFFNNILKDFNNKSDKNLTLEEKSFEGILEELYNVVVDRKNNPKQGSYTNYLLEKGLDKILKKIGEEATEVVIAAKNKALEEIRYETADLFYHIIVLMVERGIKLEEVFKELKERR